MLVKQPDFVMIFFIFRLKPITFYFFTFHPKICLDNLHQKAPNSTNQNQNESKVFQDQNILIHIHNTDYIKVHTSIPNDKFARTHTKFHTNACSSQSHSHTGSPGLFIDSCSLSVPPALSFKTWPLGNSLAYATLCVFLSYFLTLDAWLDLEH